MAVIQVVLTRAEVSAALASYAAQQLPPGRNLEAEVFVFGTHPKTKSRASVASREALLEMFSQRGVLGGDRKPEDALLAEWGAIVALTDQPTGQQNGGGSGGGTEPINGAG